ncbi:DUF4242 domain-containing protein [Seongchinamella sediminis]|uniref:DUF4242 domain-containing protein n=1 Tax=Seongchinamella sediminis TaxID=2283635 RepID=A0A3L7E0Y5_9GAMM|nr:DUF4242 domain-containing protein [Seongchinamella sediminis]RLQ22585.1 DUF4242 domain-containing protein [Seongchinamella sediminis]
MALYLVERDFSQEVNMSAEELEQIKQVTSELGADWLYTFLSADKKKSYCIYEATDTDQLMKQAQVVGLPINEIVEVSRMWPGEGFNR